MNILTLTELRLDRAFGDGGFFDDDDGFNSVKPLRGEKDSSITKWGDQAFVI